LHLKPFFGGLRAVQMTSPTLNRERAVLKRMFSIALRSTPPKVASVPYVAMLKENQREEGLLGIWRLLPSKPSANAG
jgi:hypothetical protein